MFTSRPYFQYTYVCSPSLTSPKKPKSLKNFPDLTQLTAIPALFRGPLLKGPSADLILTATRFIVTHFLISFFIQNPFSRNTPKTLF
jgi:hypothetical protein